MRLPSTEPSVRLAALVAGLLLAAAPQALARQATAPAQARPSAVPDTGFEVCQQWKGLQVEKNHIKLSGAVECRRGDLALFADDVEIWTDTHRVVLTGNVTFRQRNAQITAERAEFNSETRLGTFQNASGFATITTKAKKNPMGGQEPDVYFYGDTIEKIGADRYRITHGAFTTCVQPTPRWQITARTVTLRLDHYALLKNAVYPKIVCAIAFFYPQTAISACSPPRDRG
jgi:lipopolysaccharide assembly outer membrane protein LptD (OstA)